MPHLKTAMGIALLFQICLVQGQTNVITQHNNLLRTGWNSTETALNQSTVSGGNFGELFSRAVDDQVYAQPLIVNHVTINGNAHNIVIVATVNNSVYAFDADDPNQSAALWQSNLTYNPGTYRPVNKTDMVDYGGAGWGSICGGDYHDFSGNMGIIGTPVIDTLTGTLYVVSKSVSIGGSPPTFVQYIHALDITTGGERNFSPVLIQASAAGAGWGTDGTNIAFNSQLENQRPGLLLYNGVVYVSWASHCDWGSYHGWVIGYGATDLSQQYVYNATPDGGQGGIWMSGQAPAVDNSGNIYVSVGNGQTGTGGNANDPRDRGESLVKLSASLQVQDFFTPMDYDYLNQYDLDYGSDGVLLIPNTNLSLSGSKESYLYLIDNTNMGKTTSNNSNVLQQLNVNASSANVDAKHLHGSPVYFMDNNGSEYVYAWAETGLLKQFPFDRPALRFDTLNKKVGNTVLPYGMPGAMLAVSSKGSQQGTGILWASHPINGDANLGTVPGILQAFDATDVTHELWNSNMNGQRDAVGNFAKFVCPTIANGKVYLATFSNRINVYGPNPAESACQASLPSPWKSVDIGYVASSGDACYDNGVYTVTASGTGITGTADAFHSVYQVPAGTNTTITARVLSVQNNNATAEAGVMFRANLDPGSVNVFFGVTSAGEAMFQNRAAQSNTTGSNDKGYFGMPYWVRINNTGNKYVAFISADGNNWTAKDSVTMALGTTSYAALGYSSADNSVLGTATIDNLTVTVDNPLPVNITSFTGKNINNTYTELRWTTASETGNDYFDIERSSQGDNFAKIGTLKGAGTTALQQQYLFNDQDPADGINYYRLKQVDLDGHYTYSPVVAVRFDLGLLDIYPNPTTGLLYIKDNPNFSEGAGLNIELTDALGQVVYRQQAGPSASGIISVQVPAKVIKGIYIIRVTNAHGQAQNRRIFINR